MDTQSPSERHPFGVMPVTRSIMASSTLVSHASLNLMFNVVWSQKSLLIKVISTNSYGDRRNLVFCCTTCEFTLDFKCARLPQTTRYKQHEHPFTLNYTVKDDSSEYYYDICEKERNSNHWFYYCADYTYAARPKCILGKHPNLKFGGTYTLDCHQHPLTFIEETKDDPSCHICNRPCENLIYQCMSFYILFYT